MGLYAYFEPSEEDYPSLLEEEFNGHTEIVEVDYSNAYSMMEKTFFEVAYDLVPVDTGYLESTIGFESDYTSYAEFVAMAEYAQYVEYGTYKMDAQPYFRPAIEQAVQVFAQEAKIALSDAQEQMEALLSAAQSAFVEAFGGGTTTMGPMGPMVSGGSFGGWVAGNLAFFGLAFLFFPLLVNLYGIMDTFNLATGGKSTFGSGPGWLMPDIEIIDF